MFSLNRNTIVPEPIPERVFSVCQYIQRHSEDRSKLQAALCMSDIFTEADNNDIFNQSLNTAEELGLVEHAGNQYSATEALKRIKTIEDFRRHAANVIFHRTDTLFFSITSTFCEHAEEMMEYTKWETVVESLSLHGVQNMAHNAILGWRFWVSFLGCGYLHEATLIANWCLRFQDVLSVQKDFAKAEKIPIDKFISWLEDQCPEIRKSRSNTQLGLAVSNGLRTLEKLGQIELIHQRDAVQWQLYRFESNNEVSHVRIVR